MNQQRVEYVPVISREEINTDPLGKQEYIAIADMLSSDGLTRFFWALEQQRIKNLTNIITSDEKEAIKTVGEISLIRFLRAFGMAPKKLEKATEEIYKSQADLFNEVAGLKTE